jgi:hypothetical protein
MTTLSKLNQSEEDDQRHRDVDPRAGRVWSGSERQPASVLGLQEELSTAIAEQGDRVFARSVAGLGRRQTRSPEACDAYLQGRFQAGLRTPEGNARAVDSFKRAVAIDANYAHAGPTGIV